MLWTGEVDKTLNNCWCVVLLLRRGTPLMLHVQLYCLQLSPQKQAEVVYEELIMQYLLHMWEHWDKKDILCGKKLGIYSRMTFEHSFISLFVHWKNPYTTPCGKWHNNQKLKCQNVLTTTSVSFREDCEGVEITKFWLRNETAPQKPPIGISVCGSSFSL